MGGPLGVLFLYALRRRDDGVVVNVGAGSDFPPQPIKGRQGPGGRVGEAALKMGNGR